MTQSEKNLETIALKEISRILPNIYQRIQSIMREVEYIAKGSAQVNGQYRFVGHDAVVGKLHNMLVKHGIVIIPTIDSCTQVGNRTEVRLIVTFMNVDAPEDRFSVAYVGYGIDSQDKGPGKAISYALKYALLKVFCLETGDDPDNDANVVYEPEKCQEFDSMLPTLSKEESSKLKKFLADISKTTNKHVEDVKREAIKRMPEFIKAFEKWNPKKKDDV